MYDECVIGISPTPNEKNHYRLGTVFLRNFYIALDYENNQMGFAQNVDMWDHTTDFDGNAPNPHDKNNNIVVILIICFVVLVLLGYCIYY